MSGVLGQDVRQQALVVHRGITESFGGPCQTKTADGVVPVDLTDWILTLTVSSQTGDEWLTFTGTGAEDGICEFVIDADALTGPVWAGRCIGKWKAVGTTPDNPGVVEVLGYGEFRIID